MDTRTHRQALSGRAPDPRSQATVAALEQALRTLLVEHPLDELTVSGLCARAGVSRTSLYTHFPTVPDMLATMLVDDIEDWMGDPSGRDPGSTDYASVMRTSLRRTLRRIETDRLLFARAFQASRSSELRVRLVDAVRAQLERFIHQQLPRDTLDALTTDVVITYSAHGAVGVMEAWALRGGDDLDEWVAALERTLPAWWPR